MDVHDAPGCGLPVTMAFLQHTVHHTIFKDDHTFFLGFRLNEILVGLFCRDWVSSYGNS